MSGESLSNENPWWWSGTRTIRFAGASLSTKDSKRIIRLLCYHDVLPEYVSEYHEMNDFVSDYGAWLLSLLHLQVENSSPASSDPQVVTGYIKFEDGRRAIKHGLQLAEKYLRERRLGGPIERWCKYM